MRDVERCPATGKRRYRDHEQAIQSLRKFQAGSTRDVVQKRVYECTGCHGWHLTSQEVWTPGVSTRKRGARKRPS